jgi:asparagine synthase (glutamine-hydrolysing)
MRGGENRDGRPGVRREDDTPIRVMVVDDHAVVRGGWDRGPDDHGIWMDGPVGLAHRRLAIIDVSPEGHQPMMSPCGRYVILLNGEIYNYRELRHEIESHNGGIRWRGHSDTEVLAAAVSLWGLQASLPRLNGMFALVVYDRVRRLIHFARDRIGEKPLYHGWQGSALLFASEIKALRCHALWRGEVDTQALADYARLGYVPAPRSIFRGIAKLPPGHFLTLPVERAFTGDGPPELESRHPQPYWRLADAVHGARSDETRDDRDTLEELERQIGDSVRSRMVADVPIGAFLSGGIDSSAVTALMQVHSPTRVRTYTIGFREDDYDEAGYAREVARHLGTEHTELYLTHRDALDLIPSLPHVYDEPFADASQIPTILVSRLAAKTVKVVLSGDGGDEVFGGYTRYLWLDKLWKWFSWMPQPVRRALGNGMTAVSPQTWNGIYRQVERLVPLRWRQRQPGDKLHKLADVISAPDPRGMYVQLISQWKQVQELLRDPLPLSLFDPAERRVEFNDVRLEMMYLDTLTYLPDDILVKVDRASMTHSLESRIPFLDHRLIELVWSLPMRFRINGNLGKWALRQVLRRHVPPQLIERPKMGFSVPIGAWLRGPLRDWADGLLAPARIEQQGYLRPEPISRAWREHVNGTRNWEYALWNILMFQSWLETT